MGCKVLAPRVEALVNGRDDATLRVINIGGGSSAVVNQYQVPSVPYLVLYEDGVEVARGREEVLARLGD